MKMMRLGVAAALAVFVSGSLPVQAQDAPPAGTAASTAVMTHGAFARKLCERLGLYRFLPANPSDLDCMILLSQNGIFPSISSAPTPENPTPGWNLDAKAPLTVAEMAVLLVRAMKMEDSVKGDVNNPENWLAVLRDYQIPVDQPEGALGETRYLRDLRLAIPIFEITGDPLVARHAPEAGILEILGNINLYFIKPDAIKGGEQGVQPRDLTPT